MFKKSPFRSFFWNHYFNTIYVNKNVLKNNKKNQNSKKERKRTKKNEKERKRTKRNEKRTKYYLKIILSYIYNEKI